jgi:hypothetical protein
MKLIDVPEEKCDYSNERTFENDFQQAWQRHWNADMKPDGKNFEHNHIHYSLMASLVKISLVLCHIFYNSVLSHKIRYHLSKVTTN